jgi:serine/threonine protein kinase
LTLISANSNMHIDKIIQNYRLVRFLGDGGMGQVWLAEHTLLGRKVAIKSLHQQFARNAGIRARFKQEASTLAHLQHPNIVALHDYIEDGDGAFLVMEYVDGMQLDEFISRTTGPIPTNQLKQLFGQILDGFIYAHGKKVVHRDIKPGNILVTEDGIVKILDFGIAKILTEGNQKLTKTGANLGTVLYMSPEQVKGETVDVRSDVYSLGVTLFQMATGQSPYLGEATEFYVYDQIVNHPLPSARKIYPGVTGDIEAVIRKATEKVAERRYQDCGEFKRGLMAAEELPETQLGVEVGKGAGIGGSVEAGSNVASSGRATTVPDSSGEVPGESPKKGFPFPAILGMVALAAIVILLLVFQPWAGNKNRTAEELRIKAIRDSLRNDSLVRADAASDRMNEASHRKRVEQRERENRVELSEREAAVPEDAVKDFYAQIGSGNWDAAYELTIMNPFGRNGDEVENYFGCSNCCRFLSASHYARQGNFCKVRVNVELTDCDDGEESEPELKFQMEWVDGKWKIRRRVIGS